MPPRLHRVTDHTIRKDRSKSFFCPKLGIREDLSNVALRHPRAFADRDTAMLGPGTQHECLVSLGRHNLLATPFRRYFRPFSVAAQPVEQRRHVGGGPLPEGQAVEPQPEVHARLVRGREGRGARRVARLVAERVGAPGSVGQGLEFRLHALAGDVTEEVIGIDHPKRAIEALERQECPLDAGGPAEVDGCREQGSRDPKACEQRDADAPWPLPERGVSRRAAREPARTSVRTPTETRSGVHSMYV